MTTNLFSKALHIFDNPGPESFDSVDHRYDNYKLTHLKDLDDKQADECFELLEEIEYIGRTAFIMKYFVGCEDCG